MGKELGNSGSLCNPSYSKGRDQEDLVQSQPRQIILETLSQKYSTQNIAAGVAQVVRHLPSKHEFKPQSHKKGGGVRHESKRYKI
jgi:hypothetical protein